MASPLRRPFAEFLRTAEAWRDRMAGTKRVHLLHIGKTGGTALKAALAGASSREIRFILHRHATVLAEVPEGEACIFFVRDPVSRFVSGFLSRQRQGRPRHDFPWSAEEGEAFASFATANELALALSSSDYQRRRAAEAAMGAIMHVKDHYWRWFGNETYLTSRRPDILFIGSQEHLEQDVSALSLLTGIRIELPIDEWASHRSPRKADRKLDPQAVANLVDWYRDDYECLRLLTEWLPHLPDYVPADPG